MPKTREKSMDTLGKSMSCCRPMTQIGKPTFVTMHTYVLQRFANATNSRVYDYEHNHYAADVYRSKGALKNVRL